MKGAPHRVFLPWCLISLVLSGQPHTVADIVELDQSDPVPVKPIHVSFPWFATSEISGYAEVLFLVEKDGQTSDFLVLKSSHRAFSMAVIKVLEETQFHPATIDGRPVSSRVIYKNHFVSDRSAAVRKIAEASHPYRVDESALESFVAAKSELDRPLERLKTVSPEYPESFREKNMTGGVMVEFFVDQEGNVRAPIVISSSDESLSESVLNAIRLWKFSPPTKNNKAVFTQTRQQFYF